MANLRVAFWNVFNLFEPNTHDDRGPQSDAELAAKLDRLAQVIDSLFGGNGPDLIGLAEVHNDRLLDMLSQRLAGTYGLRWEDPGYGNQTGLGVLGRTSVVSGMSTIGVHRPSALARPRIMIAEVKLQATAEPFLFIVNHWKSRMRHPTGTGLTDSEDRTASGEWLRDRLSETTVPYRCAIIVGDFNAEPTEQPFGKDGLNTRRYFHQVSGSRVSDLYNTAWRYLTEPLNYDAVFGTSPRPNDPRAKTTHDRKYVVWDQLLVSGPALKVGAVRLLESTVEYHHNGPHATVKTSGAIRPVRWTWKPGGTSIGASDHLPITAELAVV